MAPGFEEERELTDEELAELDMPAPRFPPDVRFVRLQYSYRKSKYMYVPVEQFDEGTVRIVEKYHRKRKGSFVIQDNMEGRFDDRRYVMETGGYWYGSRPVRFRGIENLPADRKVNVLYDVNYY